MNTLKGKKAVFYTLGCKLNFAETSSIQQQLKAAGVETAGNGEAADICIVNTCSVTEVADSKSRQAISRLRRKHTEALMVVTGCYAQLRVLSSTPLKEEDKKCLENIDLVVNAKQKGDIPMLIEEALELKGSAKDEEKEAGTFFPACACGERTRFFLKVQDGCNYFCTYCTIPFARGRSRNGSIASLVRQAEEAAKQGGKEIVLTGVNIGDFGKTTGESFIDLIRALDGVAGISRYRISSLEPDLLTDEIIDFVACSRAFMPHFHIPLQSGSDEVLRLMRRRYDSALFRQKVQRIKAVMPHAFIGVDVIVGTRGETDEHFRQTYDFLRSLDVTQLHVFSYSERPGTAALKIDGPVPSAEKHRRSELLLALSAEKTHAFYASHIGSTATVLLEHQKRGLPISGFTENYIRVEMAPSPTPLKDNTLVHVRLGDFSADGTALKGKEESEQ